MQMRCCEDDTVTVVFVKLRQKNGMNGYFGVYRDFREPIFFPTMGDPTKGIGGDSGVSMYLQPGDFQSRNG
jgi:hypothetical protein